MDSAEVFINMQEPKQSCASCKHFYSEQPETWASEASPAECCHPTAFGSQNFKGFPFKNGCKQFSDVRAKEEQQ